MEQNTGAFIAQLRKEQQMTQSMLAEALHITDKAVSKWETGRSLPDVSLLLPLSQLLGVSVTELLHGARIEQEEVVQVGDNNTLNLLQKLKKARKGNQVFTGAMILVLGMIIQLFTRIDWESAFGQFISGLALGLSVGLMLLGLGWMVFAWVYQSRK